MATTIVTKSGSGAPTASDLVAGELAVDLTNGRLYTEDSGGTVLELGLNPSGNVDVTGTVTADGLTVANTSVIAGDFDGGTAATYIRLQDDTDNFIFGSNNSLGNFLIKNETSDAFRLSVANTGDISFYEDTGTTPKFFWDASAESLGIGTSSNESGYKLDVRGWGQFEHPSGDCVLAIRTGNNTGTSFLYFGDQAAINAAYIGYNHTSDSMSFKVNAGVAATIDSSGNVGIGSSSTDGRLKVSAAIGAGGAGSIALYGNNGSGFGGSNVVRSKIESKTDGTAFGANMLFYTNDTSNAYQERMRLDASGNLLVGTTTSGNSRLRVAGSAVSQPLVQLVSEDAGDLGNPALYLIKKDNNNTTAQTFVRFVMNGGSTANGQINGNGASQAAFGTWSDRRLKENIEDLPSQLDNITSLRPVEFDYIESEGGGHQLGFIAQEVEEIYPDLVGEREDGMKTLSGMGKMEARLIKAIQEQQATIEALTARIAALES